MTRLTAGSALGSLGGDAVKGLGFGLGYGFGIRVGYQDLYPLAKDQNVVGETLKLLGVTHDLDVGSNQGAQSVLEKGPPPKEHEPRNTTTSTLSKGGLIPSSNEGLDHDAIDTPRYHSDFGSLNYDQQQSLWAYYHSNSYNREVGEQWKQQYGKNIIRDIRNFGKNQH